MMEIVNGLEMSLKEKDGVVFFLFYQSKLMPHFVPITAVFPNITLEEKCLRQS